MCACKFLHVHCNGYGNSDGNGNGDSNGNWDGHCVGNGDGNDDGDGDGNGNAVSSLFIIIASLSSLCLPLLRSSPPSPSSPNPLTSLAHPSSSHPPWSSLLVDCCMFMGGRSKRDDFVIARAPPPLPSSSSPFTYLACPTIARHILLDHHGWLIVILRVVREGSVHSIAIAGLPVGCRGINYACMQVFLT